MTGYFDPLPKSSIDQAKILKWVQEQTNTFYRHITLNGLTSSDTVLLADGSLAAPSLSFSATGQQDVGIFRDGNDAIAFAINGAKPVRITQTVIDMANVVRLADGSAATPAYSFSTSGREDDGIFSAAEGAVGVAVGGAEIARFTADGIMPTVTSTTQVEETTTQSGITSATFAAGSPACGVAFVAPPSGEVKVTVGGTIQVTLSGNVTRRAELSWELREGSSVGSGTVVVAADIDRSVSTQIGATSGLISMIAASDSYVVTGLTPGASYNVQTMHRINIASSVSGDITHRRLIVEPVL